MKIINFSFIVRQAVTIDGLDDSYYVTINEDGNANISHPYKRINHEEQTAILSIIQTGIIQYAMLVKECDKANKRLKLEEYAEVSVEEQIAVTAAKLSAKLELESASSQSCALGDGEVSKEADADIDKIETVRGLSDEGFTIRD